MITNWNYRKVGEIAEKVGMGPFGSSIKVETFVPSGIPVISGQHLHGIRLEEDVGFNFVSEEHAEKLKSANVFPGDIIFTHAGNIGNVAYIPQNSKYRRYVASQRQFYMRCNLEKVLPEYVTYYFKTHEGQHRLKANSSSVGVPSIAQPVSYLRQVEIPVPPLDEQYKIINVLGTIDDKIELNRRMNQTLESIAQALFLEWFVENPEAEGWELAQVGDVCDSIFSGGTPSTLKNEYWDGYEPWLSSGETRNKYIIDTEKKITQLGVNNSSTRYAEMDSTVVASAGQGKTRGQTALLLINTYINQSIIALKANNQIISDYFLYFNISQRYEQFRQLSDS